MIKNLNPNKGWCNPPMPEGREKTRTNKTSKNSKKERRGKETEEKRKVKFIL